MPSNPLNKKKLYDLLVKDMYKVKDKFHNSFGLKEYFQQFKSAVQELNDAKLNSKATFKLREELSKKSIQYSNAKANLSKRQNFMSEMEGSIKALIQRRDEINATIKQLPNESIKAMNREDAASFQKSILLHKKNKKDPLTKVKTATAVIKKLCMLNVPINMGRDSASEDIIEATSNTVAKLNMQIQRLQIKLGKTEDECLGLESKVKSAKNEMDEVLNKAPNKSAKEIQIDYRETHAKKYNLEEKLENLQERLSSSLGGNKISNAVVDIKCADIKKNMIKDKRHTKHLSSFI